MNCDENLIKEYDDLKSEINKKIELHNTLLTFTITTSVAVLTLALSQTQNPPILYLIPFCILIPMSMRIAYYRSVMSKLSAYIIVFLETNIDGLKWETRNAEITKTNLKGKPKVVVRLANSHNYECFALTVVCYVLYLWSYFEDKNFNSANIISVFWPLLLVVWEFWITKRMDSLDKERQEWIERWEWLNTYEQVQTQVQMKNNLNNT